MPTRVVIRSPIPESPEANNEAGTQSRRNRTTENLASLNDDGSVDDNRKKSNDRRTGSRTEVRQTLSRYDISASHHLDYYFICFAASIVLLVSFQAQEKIMPDVIDRVIPFKNDYTFFLSIAGTSTTGVILLAHFDKIVLPGLWRRIFHAGSEGELVVAIALFCLFAFNAYICTSPFSLGEEVPNIFFSAWIAVVTSFLLIARWMEGAGKGMLVARVKSAKRTRTKYLAYLVVFTNVTFWSALEVYLRRNVAYAEVFLEVNWEILLPLAGAGVFVSVVSFIFNTLDPKGSFKIYLLCCTFDIHWSKLESWLLLAQVALYSTGISLFVGANKAIARPSNLYFGIWGSLLVSVFAIAASIMEGNFSVISYSREDGLRILSNS